MAFNLNQSITRESAFPLDSREIFTTIALANNAKPGLYAGQKISIVPNTGTICHYTVDNDGSKTLKPLINAASGGLITASVANDGTINNLIGTFKDLYIGGDSYNVKTQIDSRALNSITITAGDGLTGGGDLTANRTLNVGAGNGITVDADAVSAKPGNGITVDATGINHADTSSQESVSANGRKYITAVTLDTYGHVTGLETGTESLEQAKLFTTTESGTANAATTNGGTYLRLFNGTVYSTSTKIQGSGAATVTSNADGTITINSTDTHNKHKINSGTNSSGNDILSANDSDSNIILGDSGVTASSYGEASAKTLTSNGNFKIPYITVNSKGIVTSVSNKTMTMPEIGGSSGKDIKFSSDLTFTEQFGKYSKSYSGDDSEKDITNTSSFFNKTILEGTNVTASYTLKTKDMDLETLLKRAFSKVSAASITQPSYTFSANGTTLNSGEIGSTYSAPSVTFKVTSVGSYTYGPATGITYSAVITTSAPTSSTTFTNTGLTATSSNNTVTKLGSSGTYSENSTSQTFYLKYSHTAGAYAKNSNGDTTTTRIDASSGGVTTPIKKEFTYTGWRRFFAGTGTIPTSNSSLWTNGNSINASTVKPATRGNSLEFTVSGDQKTIFFAFPTGFTPLFYQYDTVGTSGWMDSYDFEAATDISNVTTISAQGSNAKTYKVYYYTAANSLKDAIFKCTLQ